MTDEIIKADPQAKKKALAMLILGACFAMGVIFFSKNFFADIQQLAQKQPKQAFAKFQFFVLIIAGSMTIMLMGFAMWLTLLSRRIYVEQCFPPSGMKVLGDTKVIRGSAARRRACVGFLIAPCLLLCALGVPMIMWLLLQQMAASFH
ncbi:hypothetical protein [Candidatus Uabimicrobium amorphum]|uniref:Uncharacterized protein n=1 Tax=Uabimicrobium amorphum TaxID=2596890 RepID=A0A5S9IIM3_UABAM|nr:hypothetical protein [Candidatus Uabimicrobium amorphum]BBM82166.1 hypothetical protein UABAM_00509 [Candidatus Uabimicrobium amorphum]